MEIKNTDLFLINSGGLSYKVQARNLQNSTGTLLVNRGGSSYKCSVSDVEDDVQNNDKLLIERNGISYQVTGQVVKNWFLPSEELIRGLTWSGSRTAAGHLQLQKIHFTTEIQVLEQSFYLQVVAILI